MLIYKVWAPVSFVFFYSLLPGVTLIYTTVQNISFVKNVRKKSDQGKKTLKSQTKTEMRRISNEQARKQKMK